MDETPLLYKDSLLNYNTFETQSRNYKTNDYDINQLINNNYIFSDAIRVNRPIIELTSQLDSAPSIDSTPFLASKLPTLIINEYIRSQVSLIACANRLDTYSELRNEQ